MTSLSSNLLVMISNTNFLPMILMLHNILSKILKDNLLYIKFPSTIYIDIVLKYFLSITYYKLRLLPV